MANEWGKLMWSVWAVYFCVCGSVLCDNLSFEELLTQASNGDAEAQFSIWEMYVAQKAADMSKTEAVGWLKKSAEQGCAEAQNELGVYHDGEKNYMEAVKWWTQAAQRGHSGAQSNLGNMYYLGRGVKQDYTQAVQWFDKAAEQNVLYAIYRLGRMYEDGLGVTQDYASAAVWYTKAAKQGYADAQNNLGILYRRGRGVKKDYAEALKWFNKAIQKHGDDKYICADAYANMAGMYAFGEGVSRDLKKAVELWKSAAMMGNSGAQFNLGLLYAKGQVVEQSYVIAYKWIYLSRVSATDSALINRIDVTKERLESMMTLEQVKEALRLVEVVRRASVSDPNMTQ